MLINIFLIIIVILLGFIAFYPLIYRNRFSIKRHYKDKILVTQKKRADVEFLKHQYKLMREGFRVEYDRLREQEDACNVRIDQEKAKEDQDKTIIEQLEKLKEKYKPDLEGLKRQMTDMDLMIEGPVKPEQQPRPVNEVIENLRSVEGMLKEMLGKL